ncbi:tRNA-dihydrouridine synthase family protein [Lactiplantibacillus garii]|uniref:tRNA-dihydrouridine synthase n=1 Tax=Lactiplantibacillus garii TaxID=2306423 RepID=A0A426D3S7_9LACO|nr:tRNA-dihydrouridine synthase family protein [Lactiplantibacillus garii]RRK09333.1 tRNA-dihydrouridine synthase family protein [Lactiplantibacillus garii]
MTATAFWSQIATRARENGRPFFTMAPMEAVSNTVFRQVIAQAAAPDAFFSEFVYAKGITDPHTKFPVHGRLYVAPAERQKPVVQLWGNQAENFATGTAALRRLGFEAVDINMGCPDGTVIKNHGGSDLIRHPEWAEAVIAAAKTSGLAVSAKTRLGYSRVAEYQTWIPTLLRQHVAVLTVHLRTKQEMSKVPAHLEVIDNLIRMRDELAPETLLQINGDIPDYAAGLALARAHPGLDGIMIGRGVFANPFAFESQPQPHDLGELLDLLKIQLDLFDDFARRYDVPRFPSLKRFFKIYARPELGATALRNQMMDAKSTADVRKMLAAFSATEN